MMHFYVTSMQQCLMICLYITSVLLVFLVLVLLHQRGRRVPFEIPAPVTACSVGASRVRWDIPGVGWGAGPGNIAWELPPDWPGLGLHGKC